MKLCRVGYVDVILQAYRSGKKKYSEQLFYTVILLSRQ